MPPNSPPEKPPEELYSQTGIKDADNILREISMMPSTIETIDVAMFNYLNETLNLQVQTNKGFKKVPVVWVASERSNQIKNKKN